MIHSPDYKLAHFWTEHNIYYVSHHDRMLCIFPELIYSGQSVWTVIRIVHAYGLFIAGSCGENEDIDCFCCCYRLRSHCGRAEVLEKLKSTHRVYMSNLESKTWGTFLTRSPVIMLKSCWIRKSRTISVSIGITTKNTLEHHKERWLYIYMYVYIVIKTIIDFKHKWM